MRYIGDMKKSGTWGDHLTLMAMSRMFNCAFKVVQDRVVQDSDDVFINVVSPPNVKQVDAEFTLAHFGEIHYESTMPLGAADSFTKRSQRICTGPRSYHTHAPPSDNDKVEI